MKLTRGSKVMVTALDWGLGHASRLSAAVSVLRRRGCAVTLAGCGRSLALLRADHPDLPWRHLPSFSPRLSGGRRQWPIILAQVPWFLFCVAREHVLLRKLVKAELPDAVLSDNCYGAWHPSVRSFIITHQLHPHVAQGCPKWVERVVSQALCLMVRRFDGCLVPDIRIGGLSGDLSAPVPKGVRAHAIGCLSRMALAEEPPSETEVEWLGVVSGPEPQRGMMERSLIDRFKALDGRRVVVCGRNPTMRRDVTMVKGVEVLAYADAAKLKGLMLAAKHIVCRSGYSTIMDLQAVGRRAELIPTPGQAEQEYLAERLRDSRNWL